MFEIATCSVPTLRVTAPAGSKAGMLRADVREILMCREFVVGGGKPCSLPGPGNVAASVGSVVVVGR